MTTQRPSDDPLIGETLAGRWAITRLLSQGETATVYAAKDQQTHGRVAIKVLHRALVRDKEARTRFDREHQTGRRLSHPNLVAVYGDGELPDGRPYFAMELVDGRPLSTLLKKEPLPPSFALSVAAQVARALAVAHAAGVVHREVQPQNILVLRGDQAKLVDFGHALQENSTRITQAGMQIAHPTWMSPESARGEDPGPPADIYALGIVLFQMLCGRPPFMGSTMKILEAHMRAPPPPLVVTVAGIPTWMDDMIARLLAKDPAERPTAADAAAWLERASADQSPSDVMANNDPTANPQASFPVGVTQAADLQQAPDAPREAARPVRAGWLAWGGAGVAILAIVAAFALAFYIGGVVG